MSFLYPLAFTLLIFAVNSSHSYKKWKFENCETNNLDSCARVVYLYGNRDVVLPDNSKDMVPHCNEEKSAVKCVNQWAKKCLKAFPRQAVAMLISGAAKNIRERCAPAGTQWYLNNSKCVIESANNLHDCMDILVADIDSIKYSKDKQDWLSTACCFVDKWKRCFNRGSKPFCNEEGMKFLRWASDAYVADLTDLACSTKLRWRSERCNQLIDVITKAAKNTTEPKPKSILMPMYRLLVEYADWDSAGPPQIKPAE